MDVHILLVDDSPSLLEALNHILSNQGYQVECRSDGESGWQRLVEGAGGEVPMPDLLLLDIMMPGIDGLTLLRRIRTDERFALLPVVILTVEADPETRMQALEAGANDYLQKPVQTVELLARVKTLINWKQAERIQQRRMEHLIEAGRVILSTLDPDVVLRSIMEIVTVEMDAEDASVWLLDPKGGLKCRAAFGERADEVLGVRLEAGQGIVGWILQHGEPVLLHDVRADPRFFRGMDEQIDFQTCNLIGAPLRVKDTVIGVTEVINKRSGSFSAADLAWLQALAPLAGVAIENAQLYWKLRDHASQLEERVRERTAQIQAQYARLRAVLRSTTDGILVTNAEGEIVEANPVVQAWLTRTLSPEDAARLQAAVRDLAGRAEERPEMVLELKGLDLELSAAPVGERVVGKPATVVAVHDVSHLKALERMKSRFVTSVSHELRTPITTIKLYAALLQTSPPEKWGEYVDALAHEADRQARLVEDITQISSIDAGRLEMKPRPTPLNDLTGAVLADYRALAENRGLTLVHQPAESGPVALVDPGRMMQVLGNLVVNAIQYTPEGGKVLLSTAEAQVEGRTWATVMVADTGMGIPEDELPHVFERFFRGEGVRQMQIPGTGLGLATVKEIVELHGGQVTVKSRVGVGTAFTVRLPLADAGISTTT